MLKSDSRGAQKKAARLRQILPRRQTAYRNSVVLSVEVRNKNATEEPSDFCPSKSSHSPGFHQIGLSIWRFPHGLSYLFRDVCDRPVSPITGSMIPLCRHFSARLCGIPLPTAAGEQFYSLRRQASRQISPPSRACPG